MNSSVLALSSFVLSAAVLEAADWPQWRGPDRTGHVPAGERIPAALPQEPPVLWRIQAGDGLASPVVSGGRVFLFDHQDGKETLRALKADTGEELWREAIDEAFKDSQSTAGPRCTPLVDEDRVYAQSCRGELQCRRVADGRLVWRVNYVQDFGAVFIGEKGQAQGASRHGYNGAPVIDGDGLITLAGGTNGAGVVRLDKRTGRVIWKSQSDPAAYAPPIMAEVAGARQVIGFTAEALIALKPATGELLWRVPLRTTFARHVTTPVVSGNMVMVASHQFGLIGVRVTAAGGGLRAEQAWASKDSAINFSSPVIVGNRLYGLGPARNVICVDPQSGAQIWSQTGLITTSADKAHAGFLVLGGNILMLTDSGQLVLFAADGPSYREISRAQVCGVNWCNPAFAGGRLFLRDQRNLLCVTLEPKP